MFWDNFVVLCNQINKSPNAVCSELNFSNATATHWKQGAKPNSSTLHRIADYFNVSVEDLTTEKKQKEKAPQETPEGLDAEIIKVFSSLSEEKKQQALSYLSFLLKQDGE